MNKITKRQLIILTLGGFLSYLLFGIYDSMRGATLSSLLGDLQLNYASGGTIVMGQYAGYFAATLLVGILADRIGPKFTLVLAAFSLVFGVGGYSASSGLLSLIAFIFLSGSAWISGAWRLQYHHRSLPGEKGPLLKYPCCNRRMRRICYPYDRRAVSGPGDILESDLPHFFVHCGSGRYLFRSSEKSPGFQKRRHHPKGSKDNACRFRPLRRLGTWTMNFSNFAYMAAEIGTASWLVDFYQNVKHFSVMESSTSLSLFYIGITLGRLGGSLFVDRLGHMRSVLFASVGAAFCIIAGVFGPDAFAILASITGFCYSIIFPTSTAIISEISEGHPGRTLGIFLAFGGLGGMFGPWVVGIASDLLGLELGMALNCIFCAAIFISVFIVKTNTSSQRTEAL